MALWGEDLPIQRCTAHKHRNLLAHAPKHMHEELGNDYRDMIYAATAAEVETRRKAFVRKWRLKCRAVADSLEEDGDRLFTFTRLDPSQWKPARRAANRAWLNQTDMAAALGATRPRINNALQDLIAARAIARAGPAILCNLSNLNTQNDESALQT